MSEDKLDRIDLTLVSQSALIEELENRHDKFIWYGVKIVDEENARPRGGWSGGLISAIGMCETLKMTLLKDMTDAEGDD